jgi:hypothetical protein
MTLSVVMATIAVVDYFVPADINLGLFYCVPVVAARRSISRYQYRSVIVSSVVLIYAGLMVRGSG